MKRVIPILLVLTMLLSLLPFSASAANDAGDTFETAREIQVNTKYSDNIADGHDKDFFVFTLEQAGTISLTFEHPVVFEQKEYWCVWLYNDKTEEICFYSFLGTDSEITTYTIGLSVGTYYLRILGGDYYSNYSHRISAEIYTFKLNYTETAYAETENNESFANATEVKVNKSYIGSINDKYDKDFYQFTLDKAGTVALNFEHADLADSNEYWCVWLYNEKTEEICFYSLKGTDTEITTYTVGLPAGTYYLKVMGGDVYNDRNNRFDTETYTFKLNYTETTYAETENNESFANATAVSANKAYVGSINDKYDKDYYKFSLDNAGTVALNFEHAVLGSSDEYWCVWLYNEKTEEICFYSLKGTDAATTTYTVGLPVGTYYLKVMGGDIYSDRSGRFSTETYTFKLNYIETAYAETENNESYDNATAIALNETYSGSINDNDDKDFYKFSLTESCELSINVYTPELANNDEYWVVRVYDSQYTQIASYGIYGGSTTTVTEPRSYSAGEYYIRVTGGDLNWSGNYSYRFATDTYRFKVTDKIEHVHSYWWAEIEPTCTAKGYTVYTCACGASFKDNYKDALGHEYYEDDVVNATCTEKGYTTYVCWRCGESFKGDSVNALGHNYRNGKCTRCGKADPNYTAPTVTVSFKDVAKGAWYKDAVDYAVANGLMNGMGNNKFEPDTATNRAMLVTVLWRYEGSPKGGTNTFKDVKSGQWYTDAVTWAAKNGIVSGMGNNKFEPDGTLTREQLATILFRYAKQKGISVTARASFSKFADGKKVQSWSKDAMQWAVAKSIIGGTAENGKLYLDPQGNATRAQVATILMRFIENVLKN